MLQQDELHVLLGEARLVERAHQEDVRVSAARDRDLQALQLLDLGDPGIFADDQRGPFGTREHADGLHRIAVDARDQRGSTGRRANVERTGIEEFERLVGARRKHPADCDLVGGKFLLEKLLLLDDQRQRIVGGVIDADFAHLREGGGGGGEAKREAGGDGLAACEREHGQAPQDETSPSQCRAVFLN